MKMERGTKTESKNVNGTLPPTESDSDKCRSLVCDSSGIIIAEMVYRCMICYYVTDSIVEAKAHYQSDHMNDEDEDEQETEPSPVQSNQSVLSSNRSFNNINHSNNKHRNFNNNNINPLVPDVSLYEEGLPVNFKFSSSSSNNNNHLSESIA